MRLMSTFLGGLGFGAALGRGRRGRGGYCSQGGGVKPIVRNSVRCHRPDVAGHRLGSPRVLGGETRAQKRWLWTGTPAISATAAPQQRSRPGVTDDILVNRLDRGLRSA